MRFVEVAISSEAVESGSRKLSGVGAMWNGISWQS